jgi:hypothetical protein
MACLALGMVPDYIVLDGKDPMTYILSANIHRRHTGTAKIRVHAELGMSMNLLSTRIWA